MTYKDRSGQGCFFFFLPSSLAFLALRAGGAVSSRQAHCPGHALKLDVAPPRKAAVQTHTPPARHGEAKGAASPDPREKPWRRGRAVTEHRLPWAPWALDLQT